MTSPRFGERRARSGAAVPLGSSSTARLRDSPSYPPALWEFSSEREQPSGVTMVVITGRNRSRRRYEQSEPTEPRPATRRPTGRTRQAGPTAGRRRPAEARPAAAGARKGRTGRSGRTAPGRTRAKPLNDLRQFGPGFGRGFFAVS